MQIVRPLVSNTKGFIEERVWILDHNEACLPSVIAILQQKFLHILQAFLAETAKCMKPRRLQFQKVTHNQNTIKC